MRIQCASHCPKIDTLCAFLWTSNSTYDRLETFLILSNPVDTFSKTIAATGIMTLVEKSQIDLDKPIIDYLKGIQIKAFVGTEEDVTVRHLLNHRSGMPSYAENWDDDDPEGPRDILETVNHYGIITVTPGTAYIYCNLGYQLLGYLISEISGIYFSQYIEENVFLPLGMTDSKVHEKRKVFHQSAVCYTPEFLRIPAYSASYPGASDIYSSAHDVIRFAMFHLKDHLQGQNAILSDETIEKTKEVYPPSNTRYGIGWNFDINGLGYRSVHHGGEGPGVDNFMRLIPSEDIALVILCNSECGNYLSEIQEEICTALIPEFADIGGEQPSSDSIGVEGVNLRRIAFFWFNLCGATTDALGECRINVYS